MNRISSFLERVVFGNRRAVLAAFAVLTALLVASALHLKFDTNLKKMVPLDHPWIQNLFKYKDDLGLGNDVQIAVESVNGDIFDPHYLAVVKQVSDRVMEMEGIDSSNVKSLWTPNVRWTEVTAGGFQGGNVTAANCASCHGKTAKGDGPAAASLKQAPADLTTLAKHNGGKYPSDKVTHVLRGQANLSAHGDQEMPVWGPVFWHMSQGHEEQVHMRIANLNRYIESLQEK